MFGNTVVEILKPGCTAVPWHTPVYPREARGLRSRTNRCFSGGEVLDHLHSSLH